MVSIRPGTNEPACLSLTLFATGLETTSPGSTSGPRAWLFILVWATLREVKPVQILSSASLKIQRAAIASNMYRARDAPRYRLGRKASPVALNALCSTSSTARR